MFPTIPELREPLRAFTRTITAAAAGAAAGSVLLAVGGGGPPATVLGVGALATTGLGTWQLVTDRHHPGWFLLPGGVALVVAAPGMDRGLAAAVLVGFAFVVAAAGYFVGRGWALLLTGILVAAGAAWIVARPAPPLTEALETALLVGAVGAGAWAHDRNARFMRRTAIRRAALFTNAADAIVVADASMRVVEANQTAAEAFGAASSTDLVGRELARLLPGAFSGDRVADVERFLTSPERAVRLPDVLQGVRDDGADFPCEVTIAKVPLEERTLLMVMVHDVSAREEARRRAEELAESRLRLVASVSHEVRTPLSAVLGFAELLRTDFDALPDDERAELVETIAQQALEMSNLVEDLLVGARGELGELTVVALPVDLRAQVLQALERMAPEREVRVEGEATAVADPRRVRQVVRNLLVNAIHHGGSTIAVEIGRRGDRATIAVVDDGPGVPEELREQIFEPFVSFGSQAGRTDPIGLGLAVVRQLVELMGGTVRYEYLPGRSSFVVELPAAEAT